MQAIKDWMLLVGVALLVTFDLIILITYILVEGVRGNITAKEVINAEQPMEVDGVYIAIDK